MNKPLIAVERAGGCCTHPEVEMLRAHLELGHQLYHRLSKSAFVGRINVGTIRYEVDPELMADFDKWHSSSPRDSLQQILKSAHDRANKVATSRTIGSWHDGDTTYLKLDDVNAMLAAVLESIVGDV